MSYVARVKHQGRELTATFETLADASHWREGIRRSLKTGGTLETTRRPVVSFAEAATDFGPRALAGESLNRSRKPYARQTLASYESALRLHVLDLVEPRSGLSIADLPCDRIDARTLQNVVDTLAHRASPDIARAAAAAISAVLRDLYGLGVIDELPPRVTLPPPSKGRSRTIGMDDAERLRAAAQADDDARARSFLVPLVSILLDAGPRITEALGLTWGPGGVDLQAETPTLTIHRDSTKTDAGARTVGLDPESASALRRHYLATGRPLDGALVFTDEKGRHLSRDGRSRSGLKRIAKTAGVDGIGPHLLRHSHGSWLASAGVPAAAIGARLGHSDPAFTMRRYVHPTAEDVAETPDRFAALKASSRDKSGLKAGSRKVKG